MSLQEAWERGPETGRRVISDCFTSTVYRWDAYSRSDEQKDYWERFDDLDRLIYGSQTKELLYYKKLAQCVTDYYLGGNRGDRSMITEDNLVKLARFCITKHSKDDVVFRKIETVMVKVLSISNSERLNAFKKELAGQKKAEQEYYDEYRAWANFQNMNTEDEKKEHAKVIAVGVDKIKEFLLDRFPEINRDELNKWGRSYLGWSQLYVQYTKEDRGMRRIDKRVEKTIDDVKSKIWSIDNFERMARANPPKLKYFLEQIHFPDFSNKRGNCQREITKMQKEYENFCTYRELIGRVLDEYLCDMSKRFTPHKQEKLEDFFTYQKMIKRVADECPCDGSKNVSPLNPQKMTEADYFQLKDLVYHFNTTNGMTNEITDKILDKVEKMRTHLLESERVSVSTQLESEMVSVDQSLESKKKQLQNTETIIAQRKNELHNTEIILARRKDELKNTETPIIRDDSANISGERRKSIQTILWETRQQRRNDQKEEKVLNRAKNIADKGRGD